MILKWLSRPCVPPSPTWILCLLNIKHCQRHNGPEGLSSAYQSNKFLHKSWLNSKIQNLNQTSAFWPNFNIKVLTKHPLYNLTKPQQQNTDQTSLSKFRLNFNFKLLTKPCAQSLNKNLSVWPNVSFRILTKPCAQSLNKRLVLCPNLSFQICNRLLPTRSSSSTSATVTTSTSFM